MLCDFQQRHAGTPYVGGDGIALPSDTLGSHVVRCADERVRVTLSSELAADTKIAEFDLPVAAEEDIAGFDVTVDNFLAVEIGETV